MCENSVVCLEINSKRFWSLPVVLMLCWCSMASLALATDGVVTSAASSFNGRFPKPSTDLWSFQPVVRTVSAQATFINRPDRYGIIDSFITHRLEKEGLSPAPRANRRTLIRRLHMTLHGLPPTAETMTKWLNDGGQDWYERLVDELLASPRYGERWATHWLDLVRYADSTGFETNRLRPSAYRYRDYVIQAFNEDTPYNRFVTEQLAGDALGVDAATGFLVAGPHDIVAGQNAELAMMQRSDGLADIVNVTTTSLLGLTVACARCHDHKFDAITQRDYYATEAVFSGVQHAESPLRAKQYDRLKQDVKDLTERVSILREDLDDAAAAATGHPVGLAGPAYRRPGTIGIDDDGAWPDGPAHDGATILASATLEGNYPPGAGAGQRDDGGDTLRTANISGGKFRYLANTDDSRHFFSWNPQRAGRFRVWLSWAAAGRHSQAAAYAIDRDGNLHTLDDRAEIAVIDQRKIATGGRVDGDLPRWSGFYDAGVHDFESTSCIVLSSGVDQAATTADLLILQSALTSSESETPQPELRAAVNASRNVDRFAPVEARFVRFETLASVDGEPGFDELEIYSSGQGAAPPRNLALASTGATVTASGTFKPEPYHHRLELINDGQYGNQSTWICDRTEGGWVQIELPHTATIDCVAWSRDGTNGYVDRVPTRYRILASSDGSDWRLVSASDDRLPVSKVRQGTLCYPWITWTAGLATSHNRERMAAYSQVQRRLEKNNQRLAQWPMAYAGQFTQPPETHRLERGDPMSPAEIVTPDCLGEFGKLDLAVNEQEQRRRLAYAEWLCHPGHPLTARVMVNRIWQHQFGRGLVATPSDFGEMGSRPSHPELLDFLASEFVASGWSVKHIQRLIALSHAYQQSSAPTEAGAAVDASNVLLWRFAPQRVEAEVIRDGILQASGKLDLTMGGPGFSLFDVTSGNVFNYEPKTTFGPAEWRRMIYAERVRGEQDATVGVFDCPDGGQTAPRRDCSTTPLQALNLLNSPFVEQQTEFLAKRAESDVGSDLVAQIVRLFELTLQREPERRELAWAHDLATAHGLVAVSRALVNCNEFLFVF